MAESLQNVPQPRYHLPPGSPLQPFDWASNAPYAAAVQACYYGDATPEQQKLVIEGTVEHLCRYYDISFRGTDRETSFAEGMRFVGAQLVKLTKINRAKILGALKPARPR